MVEPRRASERFVCAPDLRVDAHERVSALQFKQIHGHLERIEEMVERLERRLWLAVYGVAGVILAQAFQSVLTVTP